MEQENQGCIYLFFLILFYLFVFALALVFFGAFPAAILPALIYVVLKNLLSGD